MTTNLDQQVNLTTPLKSRKDQSKTSLTTNPNQENLTTPLRSKKDQEKPPLSTDQNQGNLDMMLDVKLEPILPSLDRPSSLPTPLKSKKNHVKRMKRARYSPRKITCLGCNEKKPVFAKERCK